MLKQYSFLCLFALLSSFQLAACTDNARSPRSSVYYSLYEKGKVAFLLGTHERTGVNSPIHGLDTNLVKHIFGFITLFTQINIKNETRFWVDIKISNGKDGLLDALEAPVLYNGCLGDGDVYIAPGEIYEPNNRLSINLPITPLRISMTPSGHGKLTVFITNPLFLEKIRNIILDYCRPERSIGRFCLADGSQYNFYHGERF